MVDIRRKLALCGGRRKCNGDAMDDDDDNGDDDDDDDDETRHDQLGHLAGFREFSSKVTSGL